jgi:hypothetical protein
VGSISLHLVHHIAVVAASVWGIGLFLLDNSESLLDAASLAPLSQPEEDSSADKKKAQGNTNADTGLASCG